MQLRDQKDFFAGLMFVGFGLFAAFFSLRYSIGTASEMGPGYFPLMLGLLLVGMGLLIAGRAFSRRSPIRTVDAVLWRPVLTILAAVLLFALLLPSMGFAVALFALLAISSLAQGSWRWRDVVGSFIVLFLIGYLLFIQALSLPMPAWPSFINR